MVAGKFALGASFDLASPDDVKSAVNDGMASLAGMFENGHRGYFPTTSSVTVAGGTGRWVFPLANGAPTERVWQVLRASVVVYDITGAVYLPLSANQTLDMYHGIAPLQNGAALTELAMAPNFMGRFDPTTMAFDPATPYPLLTGSGLYAVLDVKTQFVATACQVTVNALIQELAASALLSRLA